MKGLKIKLILFSIIVVSIITIINYQFLKNVFRDIALSYRSFNKNFERNIVKIIEQQVTFAQKVIIDTSFKQEVIKGIKKNDNSGLNNYIENIYKRYKIFSYLVIMDDKKNLKAFYPSEIVYSISSFQEALFEKSLHNGVPFLSDVFPSPISKHHYTIEIGSPIKGEKVYGIVIGGLNLKNLSQLLSKVSSGREIFIIDKKGNVIVHPDFYRVGTSVDKSIIERIMVRPDKGKIINKNIVYYGFPLFKWSLLIKREIKPYIFEESLINKIKIYLIIGVICLFLLFFVGISIILKPVEKEIKEGRIIKSQLDFSLIPLESLILVLEKAIEEISQQVKYSGGFFFIHREGKGYSLFMKEKNNPVITVPVDIDEKEIDMVSKEKQAVLDLKHFPNISKQLSTRIKKSIINGLIFSLRKDDDLLGMGGVFNKSVKQKTSLIEQKHTLLLWKDVLSEIVSNLLKSSKIKKEIQTLTNIIEANEIIAYTWDFDALLDKVMELGEKIMEAQGCSILLIDPQEQKLKFVAASGAKKEQLKRISLNLGEGIAGWVAQEGKEVLIEDTTEDRRFSKKVDDTLSQRTRTLICVPLRFKEKIIGVMEVINKLNGQVFTNRDLSLFKSLANQAAIAIEKTRLYKDLDELFISTVKSLSAAIDAKDPYTRGHSERVTRYALMIAEEMGLSEDVKKEVQLSGLLHDIGKIGVPVDILRKTTKLSEEEWFYIKRHPVLGAEILQPIKQFSKITDNIRHHHEHYDGTGYPDGLKGEDIPLVSRILNVADAFDAMTSERPYREGISQEFALMEIKNKKSIQFDPQCADAFIKAYKRLYPIREELEQ